MLERVYAKKNEKEEDHLKSLESVSFLEEEKRFLYFHISTMINISLMIIGKMLWVFIYFGFNLNQKSFREKREHVMRLHALDDASDNRGVGTISSLE